MRKQDTPGIVQPVSCDTSEAGAPTDVPAQARTGTSGEYPSPSMISAGVKVIVEDWGICGDDLAPDLAQDVFVAM